MATSSKLRAAKSEEGEDVHVDMSPMIDMVFLLLIFFIVASTAVIVKQDPNVKPPIAKNSKKAEDGKGRIVINIYEDGTLMSEDQQRLDDDEAVIDLVNKQREAIEGIGWDPKLHLRGDKNAVFKHCRRVIRLAAKAKVEKVFFSTYGFEPN